MNKAQKIVIVVAIIAVIGVFLVPASFGSAGGGFFAPGERYICKSNVDIEFTDIFIGSPELRKPAECIIDTCRSPLSINFFTNTASEGTVAMVVNGEVHDTINWQGSFITDPEFTLKSRCVDSIDSAEIRLYDGRGQQTDSEVIR